MAGLVHYSHQGRPEIGLVIASGDPDIVRGAAAERVKADIEAAMMEVEPESLHQLNGDPPLAVYRKGPFRLGRCRLGGLPFDHRGDECRNKRRQVGEQLINFGSPSIRFTSTSAANASMPPTECV